MKIVTLRPDQFDKYAKEHLYRNYYQTSAYGSTMLKFGYGVHYLGFVDNNNRLIGATMIMFKEVFLSNKMAYAPRGILFDYTDSVKVKELVEKLKQLLGKQGFMYLKMDPYIPIGVKVVLETLLMLIDKNQLLWPIYQQLDLRIKVKTSFLKMKNLVSKL